MKYLFVIFIFIFVSCGKFETHELTPYLSITDYEIVSTSLSAYAHVYYETLPEQRVFWTTTDSVLVDGVPTPIVCCSTYSNANGVGQQLVLLPLNYSVRNWTVICYIDKVLRDTLIMK